MPFLTECVFCNHQVQVPDNALGASGRCPKCSNYFTLTPVMNLPRAASSASVRVPAPRPAAPPAISPASSEAHPQLVPRPSPSPPSVAGTATDLPKPWEAPVVFEVPAEGEGLPGGLKWIDPVGAGALLLGAIALLCASLSWLCGWVIPLSALGVLIGLMSMLLAKALGKYRLLVPIAATVVCTLFLFTALLLPGLLGPAYQAYRERDTLDPHAIRVVPLPGQSAGGAAGNADWVDASRAALQQGRVRVQVVSVSVGPAESPGAAKKKGTAEEYLVLRLRANWVEGTTEFAANPLKGTSQRKEKPAVTLTDNTGKVYAPRSVPGANTAEDVRTSSRFPVAVVEEVFAFESPPPGLEYLRLEVPAAAWGGGGAFRFTIPAAMIHRQPIGPGRPGRRSGG